MSEGHARVEGAAGDLIGYVNMAPREAPRFIRDDRTGKFYQAEFDEFCTFSHYEEIRVLSVEIKAELPPPTFCPECGCCTNSLIVRHERGCGRSTTTCKHPTTGESPCGIVGCIVCGKTL